MAERKNIAVALKLDMLLMREIKSDLKKWYLAISQLNVQIP